MGVGAELWTDGSGLTCELGQDLGVDGESRPSGDQDTRSPALALTRLVVSAERSLFLERTSAIHWPQQIFERKLSTARVAF